MRFSSIQAEIKSIKSRLRKVNISLGYKLTSAGLEKKARLTRRLIALRTKRDEFAPTTDFYSSRAWREVRYKALVSNGNKCQCCGRSPTDGVVLHVDHVKPRSKHPNLELDVHNLQILCADCNIGKSNKDETDWRS